MNLKEFVPKYLDWLKVNGIVNEPEVKLADWTPVSHPDGSVVEPPLQIVFRNRFGSVLSIGAQLCFGQETQGFYDVAGFLGVVGGPVVSWADFINPPRTVDQQFSVGPQVNGATVLAFTYPGSVVEPGKKYFQMGGLSVPEGHTYTAPDGTRYLSIKPNPFTAWLKLL